jgi:hypothetical protein
MIRIPVNTWHDVAELNLMLSHRLTDLIEFCVIILWNQNTLCVTVLLNAIACCFT